MTKTRRRGSRVHVRLNFLAYPLRSSLGVLGKRWACLVLFHIATGQAQRFNDLLRKSPGMGKRILAMRLKELERDGFIARGEQGRGYVRWKLAPKGQDVLPVLLTLIHFASKWPPRENPARAPPAPLARDFVVMVHESPVRAPP